jgi:uncharacterized membrane protein YgcG
VAASLAAVATLVVEALPVTGKNRFTRLLRHCFTFDSAATRVFPSGLFAEIEAAIARSETHHQCEIAFAVEASLKPQEVWHGLTPRQRAQRLFGTLGVWDTENNSGVLLYVLIADRSVELVTDRGVKAKLADEIWHPLLAELIVAYKGGEFRHSTLKFIDLLSKKLASTPGLEPLQSGGTAGKNNVPNRPTYVKGD